MNNSLIKYSVIIPTFNRPEAAAELIRLLKKSAIFQFGASAAELIELIVVDDNSSRENYRTLKKRIKENSRLETESEQQIQIQQLRQKDNQGQANARNTGAASATGTFLVFLDDDVRPINEFFRGLERFHQRYPHEIRLGTVINPKKDQHPLSRNFDLSNYYNYPLRFSGKKLPFYRLITANLSLPAELFRQCGGFSTKFRNYGCEDTELGIRLALISGRLPRFDPYGGVLHPSITEFELLNQKFRQLGTSQLLLYISHPWSRGFLENPSTEVIENYHDRYWFLSSEDQQRWQKQIINQISLDQAGNLSRNDQRRLDRSLNLWRNYMLKLGIKSQLMPAKDSKFPPVQFIIKFHNCPEEMFFQEFLAELKPARWPEDEIIIVLPTKENQSEIVIDQWPAENVRVVSAKKLPVKNQHSERIWIELPRELFIPWRFLVMLSWLHRYQTPAYPITPAIYTRDASGKIASEKYYIPEMARWDNQILITDNPEKLDQKKPACYPGLYLYENSSITMLQELAAYYLLTSLLKKRKRRLGCSASLAGRSLKLIRGIPRSLWSAVRRPDRFLTDFLTNLADYL